jgi:hypothetical protein
LTRAALGTLTGVQEDEERGPGYVGKPDADESVESPDTLSPDEKGEDEDDVPPYSEPPSSSP